MAIKSFADKATQRFYFEGVCPAKWRPFEKVAHRKLDMINDAAQDVEIVDYH